MINLQDSKIKFFLDTENLEDIKKTNLDLVLKKIKYSNL